MLDFKCSQKLDKCLYYTDMVDNVTKHITNGISLGDTGITTLNSLTFQHMW